MSRCVAVPHRLFMHQSRGFRVVSAFLAVMNDVAVDIRARASACSCLQPSRGVPRRGAGGGHGALHFTSVALPGCSQSGSAVRVPTSASFRLRSLPPPATVAIPSGCEAVSRWDWTRIFPNDVELLFTCFRPFVCLPCRNMYGNMYSLRIF